MENNQIYSSIIATERNSFKLWDYILGDFYKGMSIATDRYYYLWDLNKDNNLKIALKDSISGEWTKWKLFPGLLIGKMSCITAAIDVHRSMMENEIIVESDYPTYEENYLASRIIGNIIEKNGFSPMYYYSGNKSVHIHIFLDFLCIKKLSQVKKKQFMEWLREKMISCWGTNAKEFDRDLIRPTHLIRCELSRNKIGFKTFLGYSYKDVSPIPCVCHENNRIYPKLGKMRLSSPKDMEKLIGEFEHYLKSKKNAAIVKKSNSSFRYNDNISSEVRECVKAILDDDFKDAGDGFKRGMFILVNELKRVYGDTKARDVINDWNNRMGNPIKEQEIDYRIKSKDYTLTCKYIHNFLKGVGIEVDEKCKRKVFK